MVKHINAEEFEKILKENKYVVCDFWATWCGPCRMLAPVLDKMSEEFKDKAAFVKVDIDENEALAVKYGISSIPDVFVFEDGKVKNDSLGFLPEDNIREFLKENLDITD